jgi:cytoskeletal protein RodZ
VFNRGFIRSIARFLGLDEDSLVAEYALGTNGKTDATRAAERQAAIPRNWRPAAIAAAVAIAVLILSGLVVRQYYGRWIWARLHRQHAEAVAGPPGGIVSDTPGRSSEATAPLATGPPMSAAEPTLALTIEADKPAKVSVSADGKTVFEGVSSARDV